MISQHPVVWRKSSHSAGDNGACVELAGTLDRLRDSKNPTGPVLLADVPALVRGLKAGTLG
ncbi:MAG TPA: DUF397 domain-containing protein [Pseudonocardiaceae bacterium]